MKIDVLVKIVKILDLCNKPKKKFIIWSDEDTSIRVEESNTFLKTYTHRCELAVGGRGNLPLCHCEPAIGGRGNLVCKGKCKSNFLKERLPRLTAKAVRLAMTESRFAPRNDNQAGCIATPSAEQKAWQSVFGHQNL